MHFLALASDYDGTLAHDGVVDEATIKAVEHLIASGRKLILVTGRELPDLQNVFPRLDLCTQVVAENGALLYTPATREKRVLAQRPPDRFVEDLRRRGVEGMSIGDVIIATWHPYEKQAIEAIHDSGLELQIIFNKEAVMILPSGVNKMTGLCCALEELKLSRHNVAGVGDAENDHAFLDSCEFAVAVANAIPALKEKADLVTQGARGTGVAQLIEQLLQDDLSVAAAKSTRHCVPVGKSEAAQVTLPAFGRNLLVCGQSGSGKSTVVTGLLERIMAQGYQICLVDPEGDYENIPNCRTVGDAKRPPEIQHVKQVLEKPDAQVVVNLVGVAAPDRPAYFAELIAELQAQRLRAGRPHWLVIDETHHVLPREWALSSAQMPEEMSNLMLLTVHPGHVSLVALRKVNTVLIVGREPRKLMDEFASVVGCSVPEVDGSDLPKGEALLWWTDENRVVHVKTDPPRSEHHRHRRKYAEGELEPERVFHFRGPHGKLDLRAQNLNLFVQIAEGIDEETWQFHLRNGDVSEWLRRAIKDEELADQVKKVEDDKSLPDPETRKRVKEAILAKYTAPA